MRIGLRAGVVAVAAGLASAAPAGAYTYVPAGNGERWGVHDAAPPRVDTGSIRDTSSAALMGYGGIRVRVSRTPEPRLNGALMRGFGLRFDGLDRLRTTRAVDLGGVVIERSIRVRRSATWARWVDSFTNTARRPVTVEVVFGGQTGYGTGSNQSAVVDTSSGDAAVTPDDAWAVVASGSPSFNGPSAVVIGATTRAANFLRDPFDEPLATAGHEANFQGYENRFTLQPGQTRTLAHFVVIGRSEVRDELPAGSEVAAVRDAAAALAAAPELADVPAAQICALANWDVARLSVPGFDPADCEKVVSLEPEPVPDPAPRVTSARYDVVDKSIGELQAAMEAGRTTAQEITRAYLDRIAAYDGGQFGFNSYTTVARDAMRQARRADRARDRGKRGALLGIPVAVKDLYDTKDMPTTNGSLVFEGFRPTKDAFQVARLRAAGAVIIGKASMEEYATFGHHSDSAYGQVWNAFDPSKSPLGSSGGSAVATAASLAGFALGSQTGDSLYGPASAASLVTMRGTDGMASSSGVMPLVWLQDYAGAMTRTVSDLADVLNVTTGTDPDDPATEEADAHRPRDWRTVLDPGALKGKRIGYDPAAFVDPFGTAGTIAATKDAFRHLRAAGAEIVEMPPAPSRPSTEGLGDRNYHGWQLWIDAHPESPYKSPVEIITSPLKLPYARQPPYTGPGAMTPSQVAAWKAWRAEYKDRLARWMDDSGVDAVAYPGLLSDINLNDGTRPTFGRRDPPSSGAGVPSVAVPAGRNDHGEPIDLQLMGREWEDAKVLGYAYAFERRARGHVAPDTVPRLRYDP